MQTTCNDFQLIPYLRADLLRAREIKGQTDNIVTSVRLWLGIFSPRFIPVLLCRLAHRFYLWGLGPIAKLVSLVNFFLFGIEIAVRCPIGPGLFFPHTQGTVIGAASIGRNSTIFQGVTLGALELDLSFNADTRPILGDDVIVGSGAKILGGIILGHNITVGANAVVLKSMPDNALAVGVPAKNVSGL